VLLLLLGGVLLWPALYNGQPLFFDDTPTYLRAVDAGVYRLTGQRTVWTRAERPAAAPAAAPAESAAAGAATATPAPAAADPTGGRTPLAGRSAYYGALLYLGERTGGFWLTLALQAAALLLALGLTLRHWGGFTWTRLALLAVGLALLTPAAFYAGYLMPDLFAGVTVLAVASLAVFGRRMGGGERLAWLALLVAALLFHSSHLLLTASLLGLAVPLWLWRRRLSGQGIALAGLALALGLAGESAFNLAVERLAGVKPVRPPFLMARLIADGPGYEYMKQHCPAAGFTVCDYMDRLPTLNSDVFLWSEDPRLGVFMAESGAVKRRLSGEQLRFALAVIADDPLAWLRSAARNAWQQLSWFGVPEFNYNELQKANFRQRIPQPHLAVLLASRAGQGTMPVAIMGRVIYAATLASLLAVAVWGWRHRRDGLDTPAAAFVALVLAGLLANALICGLLSTPHDRYQARVIWLLPLLAGLLALRARPAAPDT